jgi:hypothetical protein
MSELDKPVPPAGEEIHLPGGSLQPIIVAVAITVALIGVTTSVILVIVGLVVLIPTIYAWIRDTRDDIAELPVHTDDH